jgi:hypothetical protein
MSVRRDQRRRVHYADARDRQQPACRLVIAASILSSSDPMNCAVPSALEEFPA